MIILVTILKGPYKLKTTNNWGEFHTNIGYRIVYFEIHGKGVDKSS